MKVIEGFLSSKEPVSGNAVVVTLTMRFGGETQYVVPHGASFVDAHGGSGSTLEYDESFLRNKGKPARVAVDEEGIVWAFRASSNIGFESVKRIANDRKRRATQEKRAHSPVGRIINGLQDLVIDLVR